ncbi:MAG TPA: hypothetical protein VE566_01830, partial [Nitrososphaeraceae archaeon]|nr:hypothetical protein [Nitrososphaeraceae archaeon]
IPSSVLAVASYRRTPYIKALAVIFIGAAVIGGSSFYIFGLVTPKVSGPAAENSTEIGAENTTNVKLNVVQEELTSLALTGL